MRIQDVKRGHLNQLADYTRTLYRAPELRKLFFELTLQCNERCFHCGSSCTAARGDELSREEWLSLIDQVKADLALGASSFASPEESRCSTATSLTSWATRTRRDSVGA